jgi:N-carbamoylputrescine amidase
VLRRILRDLRVAGIQMRSELGQKDSNLKSIQGWAEKAKQARAEFACFPEMSIPGFYCAGVDSALSGDQIYLEVHHLAEPVPDGPSVKFVENISRKLGIYISAGLFELDNHIVYNSYFICGPDGFIGKYRKSHMPAVEYPFCRFGSEFSTFKVADCSVGIAICFDNTMPEVARILALKGAEIILMPHAWSNEDVFGPPTSGKYEDRRKEVLTFIPSRAYDNRAYVVYVDQVGRVSAQYSYPGFSALFNPKGEILTEAGPTEQLIVADFKKEILDVERGRPDSGLRSRRPEIYRELLERA